MSVDPVDPDRCTAHRLYRQMLRLRRFEAEAGGSPPWGGLESVPVGVMDVLVPDDAVVPSDACAGVTLLRGADASQWMAACRAAPMPGSRRTDTAADLDETLARRALRPGSVAVRFLPPGAAMPGGCGVVVHGRPERPRRAGPATVLPVEALDVVEIRRAARQAVDLARAGRGPVLLACAAREAQVPIQAGAAMTRDPFCDPIDRLRAWARDHLLLTHGDCVSIERGVEAELAQALRTARPSERSARP
jgi:TPP-dependent pyruvate/acetoin dehydrogenase alpha subunit